jgi:rRNA maturation RNase YbeY
MNQTSGNSIHFFFENVPPNLKNRKNLKRFLGILFKNEGKKLNDLVYIFCTDQALLKINKKYLDHDFYTDIITFNVSSSTSISGNIYISTDRVRENARTYQVSFQKELCRVIFHGALHLCGYDDKSLRQKKIMTKREDYYLKLYN